MSLIDDYRDTILKASGIILDANVALLYVVGSVDPKLVLQHARTSEYSPIDFYTIDYIVQIAKRSFCTPHVLTEVSNLAGKKPLFRESFRSVFQSTEEIQTKSSQGFDSDTFLELGLTDALLYELARQNYLVVTADHALYMFITSAGQPCINFAHLKERG